MTKEKRKTSQGCHKGVVTYALEVMNTFTLICKKLLYETLGKACEHFQSGSICKGGKISTKIAENSELSVQATKEPRPKKPRVIYPMSNNEELTLTTTRISSDYRELNVQHSRSASSAKVNKYDTRHRGNVTKLVRGKFMYSPTAVRKVRNPQGCPVGAQKCGTVFHVTGKENVLTMAPKKSKRSASESSSSDSGPDDRNPPLKKSKPSDKGSSQKSSSNEEEHSFQLDRNRFVKVREFRGKLFVDIREFYEKDGNILPGKKGISLSIGQWNKLKELIDDIQESVEKLG
ncbi:hypothetical protein ACI65C_003447 [Semiaphis heraclei]